MSLEQQFVSPSPGSLSDCAQEQREYRMVLHKYFGYRNFAKTHYCIQIVRNLVVVPPFAFVFVFHFTLIVHFNLIIKFDVNILKKNYAIIIINK